jgi:hypothetical protein
MSADMSRWLLVVVIVLCLLGLLLFARGPDHHRGNDEGALAAVAQAVWLGVDR